MFTARRVLIDGDVVLYRACTAVEEEVVWEDGTITYHSNVEDIQSYLTDVLKRIKALLPAFSFQEFALVFSSDTNHRKDVLPTYKGNRRWNRKPLGLRFMVAEGVDHNAFIREQGITCIRAPRGLEADDVLSIEGRTGGKVVVTVDKDLRQVPNCEVINFVTGHSISSTEEEAERFWKYQTLIGDRVDGYEGCPGIGPVKAQSLLDKDDSWEHIAQIFIDKGFSFSYYLQMKNCARLLRPQDYNQETGEIILCQH